VGTTTSNIQIFDIKTSTIAATFSSSSEGRINSLSFSENGTLLASASMNSTAVSIWDLRKTGDAARVKTIDVGSSTSSVAWDWSAQFLAIVGGGALVVMQYVKSSKKWVEVVKKARKARRVVWDPRGRHLLVDDKEEGLVELGTE